MEIVPSRAYARSREDAVTRWRTHLCLCDQTDETNRGAAHACRQQDPNPYPASAGALALGRRRVETVRHDRCASAHARQVPRHVSATTRSARHASSLCPVLAIAHWPLRLGLGPPYAFAPVILYVRLNCAATYRLTRAHRLIRSKPLGIGSACAPGSTFACARQGEEHNCSSGVHEQAVHAARVPPKMTAHPTRPNVTLHSARWLSPRSS
jgi:hypothetical protein